MAFMRQNNNGRRPHNNHGGHNRNRNYSGGQGYNNQQSQQNGNGPRRHVNRVNQVFESNGPEGRVRGTAAQIVEKYTTMARDASVSGDKVLMLNYFQHAEHYQRLLNEITEENAVFERDREAQRQQQAAQPVLEGAEAAEGFVPDEQPSVQAQPPQQREQRQDRPDRQDRQERFERRHERGPDRNQDRGPRPERAERQDRPQRAERNDAGVASEADNVLPDFLQIPVAAAPVPAVEHTAPEAAAAPRGRGAPRGPRRAPAAETAE